mmetsp:Transcript_13243/g.20806  ORF Transcript_13243/g.20806 Transcript_13243/m.20806 type:complete len:181 (-) Transcript_13243:745-1287(-)|eukprot:CAMPEP_0184296984 /NCGR_PEP_ID=MMETSP1049-20130417/7927_1 /TAXON_ID=77928 /ORGANISM="Proteomonas sulcata, Strain CCMP704" /LENGTH=180 /DNA_ID=CAMNT_0026606493 /DNA_START=107 /DNA_END=649 /DNA_ORIENTATION=+
MAQYGGFVFLPILLLAYPVVLVAFMNVGVGKWNLPYGETCCLGVSTFILLNTYWVFSSCKYYQNEDQEGSEPVCLWKPNKANLAFFCMFSPLHIPVVFLRRHFLDFVAPMEIDLGLCFCHGVVAMFLAHWFFGRELIDQMLFEGAYAKEVSFREKMAKLRRQAEKVVFTKIFDLKKKKDA